MMKQLLRTHLTTIVVAMITAAATVGAPAVAASIADYARNADKVDDRHAVGSGASAADRAGKLVATNGDGRLPNDIISKAPDAHRLDGRDSSEFVRSGTPARGDLTGAYPNPELKAPEAWKSILPAREPGAAGESTCEAGRFCSRYVTQMHVWMNYDGGFATVGFYKDPFGVIHLKGVAKQSSALALSNVFRLPEGYRPALTRVFSNVGSGDAYRAAWNAAPARIDISNTGLVTVYTSCAGDTQVCSADGRTYISFDGISFRNDG